MISKSRKRYSVAKQISHSKPHSLGSDLAQTGLEDKQSAFIFK